MTGEVSAFTKLEPKQWLTDWKVKNPEKTVTFFEASKSGEDRYSVEVKWTR